MKASVLICWSISEVSVASLSSGSVVYRNHYIEQLLPVKIVFAVFGYVNVSKTNTFFHRLNVAPPLLHPNIN